MVITTVDTAAAGDDLRSAPTGTDRLDTGDVGADLLEVDAPAPPPVEMHRPRRRWHGVTRPLIPAVSGTSGTGAFDDVSTSDTPTGDTSTGDTSTGDTSTGDAVQQTALAVRSLTLSVNRFRAAVADALQVSPTDVLALTEVSLHPGLTPGQLADRIAVGIAGTSTVIDRLVRAGYLRRVPSRLDRRTYNLTLSPAGVHAVGWVYDATRVAITDAHTQVAQSAQHTDRTVAIDTTAPAASAPRSHGNAQTEHEPVDAAHEPDAAAEHTVMHLNALAAAYYRHADTLATP